jgi:hypothetical protein
MQLIVTEKPIVHQDLVKGLPELQATGFSNIWLWYKFNYENFVFLNHPIYQHDPLSNFTYRWVHYIDGSIVKGDIFNYHEATHADFAPFSEIAIFVEKDHSAVRAADLFLNHSFGALKKQHPITFTLVDAYSPEALKECYHKRSDFFVATTMKAIKDLAKIEQFRDAYKIKDYIDFNFNGMCRQHVLDENNSSTFLTRNKLMVMLLLNEKQLKARKFSEASFLSKMTKNNIGSPASQMDIIRSMVNDGFLTPKLLQVTKKGKAFLDSLPNVMTDFNNLKEFQNIEKLKNVSLDDKIDLAKKHLSLLFADYLN